MTAVLQPKVRLRPITMAILAMGGEGAAAAPCTTDTAPHQRVTGQRVHVIDGFPGGLVAHGDRAGRPRDRAVAGDRFEQRNALRS